jgi:hypothetical protein
METHVTDSTVQISISCNSDASVILKRTVADKVGYMEICARGILQLLAGVSRRITAAGVEKGGGDALRNRLMKPKA